MRRRPWQCLLLALCLTAFAVDAGAAEPAVSPSVNPGLINKEGQQNLNQLQQQNALPKPPPIVNQAPSKQPSQAGGPSFVLRGVRVSATRFLTGKEIAAVTGKYVGTKVTIGTLNRIVDELNEVLARKHEVTASAYLPPQKIAGGVVHIEILEGRLGKIDVTGNKQLSAAFVRSYVHLQPHQIVDLPQVSDDLARFNDTGIARLQAILQPGAQFGLTDIQLAVTEPPRNELQVFADNEGVAAVGRNEIGMLYQLYSPAGIDDRLTLYAVKSAGNEMGSLAYDVPINSSGGRAGISLSGGNIHDVSGLYEPLAVSGWSNDIAANIAQPLYVGQNWIFLGTGSVTYELAKSFEIDTMVTSDRARLETGGLKAGYTTEGLSAGATATASYVQSHSDVSGQETDFELFDGTFYARGRLPDQFFGVSSGSWQIASQDDIPGSQLFQVGGPTTVRGYPSNAVAGPSGYFANFELHHPIAIPAAGGMPATSLDGFVFLDQGSVFNSYPRHQDLRSVGTGFSWGIAKGVTASLTLGFPLEDTVYGQPGYQLYLSLIARVI